MATSYVQYCSSTRYECAGSSAPDVVLCLQDGLGVDPEFPFIDATICQFYSLDSDGYCGRWNYTFAYDPADLADPSTPLSSAGITGLFCRDCFTAWVEALLG